VLEPSCQERVREPRAGVVEGKLSMQAGAD